MNTVLKNIISDELIAYQEGGVLFKSMVEILKPNMKNKTFTADKLNDTPLPNIIKKHTGISIRFNATHTKAYNAYVLIPDISNNHILRDKISKQMIKHEDYYKLKALNKKLEGTVNPKTSKVSGIFSEITSEITLGNMFWHPRGTCTAEEIAAIVLHEIGHLFSYYFFLLQTVKTNIVLNCLNRPDYYNSNKDKKIKLLEEIEKDMDFKISEKMQLASCSEEMTYTAIIRESIKTNRSEINSPLYDQRTYEFLSDQFSLMHGAGSNLATGLTKLAKFSNEIVGTQFEKICVSMIEVVKISFKLHATATLANPFILLLWCAIIFANVFLTNNTYDSFKIRLNKMKEQYVAVLMDKSINKSLKIETLQNIKTIEYLLQKYTEVPNYGTFIINTVLPWVRKRESLLKLQHIYESLAYNDLYKLSAKIKTTI